MLRWLRNTSATGSRPDHRAKVPLWVWLDGDKTPEDRVDFEKILVRGKVTGTEGKKYNLILMYKEDDSGQWKIDNFGTTWASGFQIEGSSETQSEFTV